MRLFTLMSPNGLKQNSADVEETIAFGKKLAEGLTPGAILCFFGELGAGKTTLIKGIVSGLTGVAPEEVSSPTFVYLNIYGGKIPVYHFDLYRLHGVDEFLGMGFEEYLFSDGVCCIEWSEKIVSILPESVHHLTLQHENKNSRKIIYEIPNRQIH